MDYLDKLKSTKNLSDLANVLGYKAKSVSYILYKIPNSKKYTSFDIPKKNGGVRKIHAPIPHLKILQRHLADILQRCFEELYNSEPYRKSLSHGFRTDHSIITNANNHKNKRYVFNIDLKNFFPSINFGRVRGFFIKSNDFRLDPKVATVIAQIACYDNELPQGSPASPVISNLIGHILDIRLVRLAKKARCSYSRYADDITFSTREKTFPPLIARKVLGEWRPSENLENGVKKLGFEINPNKVSMQYWINRQQATGLVVNRKVNIKAPYYRQARAMCDALFRTGEFYIGKEMRGGNSKRSPTKTIGTVNQLRGVLSYIYNVKKLHDDREITDKWANPTAIHNLFRRFLYFDKFHALQKPLILCEGKTDNVYLKCALKSLSTVYPKLINTSGTEIEFNINFFKYSKMNMDLMQFSGGTGDLPAFIHYYDDRMKPFLCGGRENPVIILVDNDSGAKEVFKKAAKKIGKKVDGSDDFYHLSKNLYLVVLPKIGSKDVMIEDFFDASLLKTIVGGKSFNPDKNTFDKDKHYGKQVLAEKVIKANLTSIDFDEFRPTLSRLEAVIADYKRLLSSS